MRKLLMRGGLSPLEAPSFLDIVDQNLLGYNAGNLVYAYSVARALTCEDMQIEVDRYACERNQWTAADIERINATYDAYLIPLADAFRANFAPCLNAMAKNIAKLTIPCYVIGVGLKAPLGADPVQEFPFDGAVERFMHAVLDKSALVGLRGYTTAAYLDRLGFHEGCHVEVIGCPSLYGFGRELEQRPLALSPNSCVSVNFHPTTSQDAMRFLIGTALGYERGQYVAQRDVELYTLYAGVDNTLDAASPAFPARVSHPLYEQDRVRFYLSAPSWIEGMRSVDLSLGGRLHGTVAAILGGAPVVFLPCDARTSELQRYHDIPCLPQDELHPGMALKELLEGVDLRSHLRRQPENFDRYLAFLAANGLKSIFDGDPCRADAPLDRLLAEQADAVARPPAGGCTSILFCSQAEAVSRLNTYVAGTAKRTARQSAKRAAEDAAGRAARKEVARALAAPAKKPGLLERVRRRLRRLLGGDGA